MAESFTRDDLAFDTDFTTLVSILADDSRDEETRRTLHTFRDHPNRLDVALNSLLGLTDDEVVDIIPAEVLREGGVAAMARGRLVNNVQLPGSSKATPVEVEDDDEFPAFLPQYQKGAKDVLPVVDAVVENGLFGNDFSVDANSILVANDGGAFLTESEEQDYRSMLSMFPNVDPFYILEQIATEGHNLEFLIDKLTSDDAYPKLTDRIRKRNIDRRRADLLNPASFSVSDFLHTFPDPVTFFAGTTRSMSALYIQHALAQLQNEFPHFSKDAIEFELGESNNHYAPARKELLEMMKEMPAHIATCKYGARCPVHMAVPRSDHVDWPAELEEIFFRELQFVVNEVEITNTMAERVEQRQRKLSQAREQNAVLECGICCGECLPDELVRCAADPEHRFCVDCVQKYAETVLGGEGKSCVSCLAECGENFKLDVLKRVLSPALFSLLLRRQSEFEIEQLRQTLLSSNDKAASSSKTVNQREAVESCPFCPFIVIMESKPEKDRLFHCQNPECLKDSCRLCRKPSHVPLRCDEVDKASLERFVENEMAEAMIRACPKCNTRIIKDTGCNHMRCTRCKSHFCYVCNGVINPSKIMAHFRKGCPQFSSNYTLHGKIAKKAGELALKKFLEEHPDAKVGGSGIGKKRKASVDISRLLDDKK